MLVLTIQLVFQSPQHEEPNVAVDADAAVSKKVLVLCVTTECQFPSAAANGLEHSQVHCSPRCSWTRRHRC